MCPGRAVHMDVARLCVGVDIAPRALDLHIAIECACDEVHANRYCDL